MSIIQKFKEALKHPDIQQDWKDLHFAKAKATTSNKIFHGSPWKFKSFKNRNHGKNYGPGIYFTEDFDEAVRYALAADRYGYVYEVDLNVKNPCQLPPHK